jgi:C4-dicarboxylate-specific signal transduction histidine kinase
MAASNDRNNTVNTGPHREDEAGLILIVEDDPALLSLMEKRLTSRGHHTVGVTDGASALAWLKHDSPSLMLLDYSLPDMHGEQLIEQLHAQGRHVPFVVATGHGSESVAVEIMKRGAYDYLIKSISFLDMLPMVVERALERARQAQRLIEAKEQLREAHEELELRVHRRTAELAEANRRLLVEMEERRRAEDQLRQHQDELAHVARLSTVGEMVVELAHELNQPLGAISSYAQACKRLLASDHPEDREELSSALVRVGEQADRAAEIVRRLRRFITKAQPMQTSVDLNALIRDVAELMDIDARMAGAEVRFEFVAPLPSIVADRIQIEQVVVNLMRNAFEAMRDCPPEFRQLVLRTIVEDQRFIRVEACDTGIGIPPAAIESVFDRFFTTKPDGMGMGLAISRSIITNHGGKLWVVRNLDRGCTFSFTLPIDVGEHSRGK